MADSAASRGIAPELRQSLPPQLPAYLAQQRWFGGKGRTIQAVALTDVIPIPVAAHEAFLLIVSVTYTEGPLESYAIPVLRSESRTVTAEDPSLRIETAQSDGPAILVDALKNDAFLSELLSSIERQAVTSGEKGQLVAARTSAYGPLTANLTSPLRPKPVAAEQSNSSIIYGDRLILKFFRRVEEGINPDLEIGLFLTEKARFPHTPQVAGSFEYHGRDGKKSAQGILQAFVPNQGDAWRHTLGALSEFYDVMAKERAHDTSTPSDHEKSALVRTVASKYLQSAELLGRRTAEMHLALACDEQDRAFAPELFTPEFQQKLEESMVALTTRVFGQLREKISSLPVLWRNRAEKIAGSENEVMSRLQAALGKPIRATRTRIHGDYHLGQVLYTGSDFVVVDFEGEPARSLAERRTKRSPLQDVAGMLRSFHYAAFAPLLMPSEGKTMSATELERLTPWAESWNAVVSDRFLQSYFETAGSAAYLPESREETGTLLELHLLEKAVYELGYELNNRPSWIGIPLQGISRLLSV
jgi:maltose alpha-D-glucosyltransferase / alpha-amylase